MVFTPADGPRCVRSALPVEPAVLDRLRDVDSAYGQRSLEVRDRPCDPQDPVVRARAAYELGRAGAGNAVPQLVNALREDQLLVREAAVRALDWLTAVPEAKPALKNAAGQVGAQLQAEQGKVQYVKVNEDLRRLHVKLQRL